MGMPPITLDAAVDVAAAASTLSALPVAAAVVVAAHVEQRRVEGIGQEVEVIGLEIAAADDRVERLEGGPVALEVEGRLDLVRDGEQAQRPAVGVAERSARRLGRRISSTAAGSLVGRSSSSRVGMDRQALGRSVGRPRAAPGSRVAQVEAAFEHAARSGWAARTGMPGRRSSWTTASTSSWPVYRRGGDAVVAVDDPVVVAELDQLDRRQRAARRSRAGCAASATRQSSLRRSRSGRKSPPRWPGPSTAVPVIWSTGTLRRPSSRMDGAMRLGVQLPQVGQRLVAHPPHAPDPRAAALADASAARREMTGTGRRRRDALPRRRRSRCDGNAERIARRRSGRLVLGRVSGGSSSRRRTRRRWARLSRFEASGVTRKLSHAGDLAHASNNAWKGGQQ